MAYDTPITCPEALEEAVLELGFLPFFRNSIPGFSVAERTPPEFWFVKDRDGPWEWKGPVLRGGKCAYGKFFRGKAVYVALEWLPDLVNARRDGYDFEGMYADGYTPAYPLLYAQITKRFKGLDLYVGGENLTNYRQHMPILHADDPFSTDFDASCVWGPLMGLKIYAGIRVTIWKTE